MLPEEIELLKKLAEFPELVLRAAEAREPHHVAYYLRELAGLLNPYVQDGKRHRVVSDDAALTAARLALIDGGAGGSRQRPVAPGALGSGAHVSPARVARVQASGGGKMRDGEPGWFASLLGAAVLIAGGFGLGLVAGVVSEEPELVVGHLVGRSEEVPWTPEGAAAAAIDSPAEASAVGGEAPLAAATTALPARAGAAREADLPPVAAAPPAHRTRAPARQSEPRPARAAPAATRSGFAVQVGAFSEAGAADEMRRRLAGRGFETYVIPSSASGDGRWRVRVGPVPSKEDAESLASRLKSEERLPTWVLTEGGG